jgi:hypothetical protein
LPNALSLSRSSVEPDGTVAGFGGFPQESAVPREPHERLDFEAH